MHETMHRQLRPAEIDAAIEQLPGWSYDANRRALCRHVELADFAATFALMTRIAIMAEKRDHHPEWANVYNRLDIWLTTHDVDGVSARVAVLADMIHGILD